jgi:hypothetical protein
MNKRTDSSAETLAIMFSDELDIPSRFKTKKQEIKINLNSTVEKPPFGVVVP